MTSESGTRECPGCGKEPPPHVNYCTWECQIAAARKVGGRELRPNGLPIRCVTADGAMLECEHGDHPDYRFPVTVEKYVRFDTDDEYERQLEQHALIYTDGSVAMTMHECCYALFGLRDGQFIAGPSWMSGRCRLAAESLAKVRALALELRGARGPWTEDGELPEDAAIAEVFPTRSGRHDRYEEAMRLVGAKRSKGALVALVNWLLHQPDRVLAECLAEAELEVESAVNGGTSAEFMSGWRRGAREVVVRLHRLAERRKV